ncbi:hypothetical protein [Microseira sp. BLCC-F43]|jgi:flagellar biosynthesis/type III secretory pathway protein FliH|uniref:hypothetical protein n=1 Tax=Microseira sp. BLCC-F43 TaxID=3153602 RepID=UPI0035B88043
MAIAPLFQQQLEAAEQRGRQEGRQAGRQEGIQEGIERGIQQGTEEVVSLRSRKRQQDRGRSLSFYWARIENRR